MKAAPEFQRRLLDLQAVDTALARLEHIRKTLPETDEARRLHADRGRMAERVVEAETRVLDMTAEADRAEADIVPVKERLERNRRRIDAGEIADPKALSAMLDESDHLEKRIGDLEDLQLEAMERLDEAKEVLVAAGDARDAIAGQLRALLKTREAKIADLDADRALRQSERDAIASALPADLLALYARIAERSGVGAALLQASRCTGCQLAVTSIDLVRYRAAAEDEVLRCEECQRILVRTAESGL